jgi:hypothetical protein
MGFPLTYLLSPNLPGDLWGEKQSQPFAPPLDGGGQIQSVKISLHYGKRWPRNVAIVKLNQVSFALWYRDNTLIQLPSLNGTGGMNKSLAEIWYAHLPVMPHSSRRPRGSADS